MAEKKLIGKCPVCSGELYISELACKECDTKIRGEFTIPPFIKLDERGQEFLMLFLRSRGSLREVQRELGLSYPTVRSRLDALLAKMGIISTGPSEEEISKVLDRLEAGDLSAEDAIRIIKKEEAGEADIIRVKERRMADIEASIKEKEKEIRKVEEKIRAKEKELRREHRVPEPPDPAEPPDPTGPNDPSEWNEPPDEPDHVSDEPEEKA